MKIEVKSWLTGNVIFKCDAESLKIAVEMAVSKKISLNYASLNGASLNGASLNHASLENARLNGASLENAILNGASLNGASLNHASLNYARLNGASLENAILNGASLNGARLDKKYYQVSCIGSRKGVTTYCVEDGKIWCGCWAGTLEEFKIRVEDTHRGNKQYLAEYKAAINFFEAMKEMAK